MQEKLYPHTRQHNSKGEIERFVLLQRQNPIGRNLIRLLCLPPGPAFACLHSLELWHNWPWKLSALPHFLLWGGQDCLLKCSGSHDATGHSYTRCEIDQQWIWLIGNYLENTLHLYSASFFYCCILHQWYRQCTHWLIYSKVKNLRLININSIQPTCGVGQAYEQEILWCPDMEPFSQGGGSGCPAALSQAVTSNVRDLAITRRTLNTCVGRGLLPQVSNWDRKS